MSRAEVEVDPSRLVWRYRPARHGLCGLDQCYLLARGVVALAGNVVGLDITFVFPLSYVLIALIGTIILALLIMLAPLRRAVRFKPGEAIRYA